MRHVHYEDQTVRSENDGQAAVSNAELDLANRSFEHVICTLDGDLQSMEQEITGTDPLPEAYLTEVKEFCSDINKRIHKDLKEAAEKVLSHDTEGISGAGALLSSNLTSFTKRLRVIQSNIRKATMLTVLGGQNDSNGRTLPSHRSQETTPLSDSHRG